MNKWAKIGILIGAIPVLLALGSLFCKYHDRFADAKEVYKIKSTMQQVSAEFQYYTLTNQAARIQERMWQLEDRHTGGEANMPQTTKEEYRRLKQERKDLLEKSKKYENKK